MEKNYGMNNVFLINIFYFPMIMKASVLENSKYAKLSFKSSSYQMKSLAFKEIQSFL